jgi:hypothetical protein
MAGTDSSASSRQSSFNSLAKDLELPLEQGCLSIIVLGASGDLAKKKTFPALYHLFEQVVWHWLVASYAICKIYVAKRNLPSASNPYSFSWNDLITSISANTCNHVSPWIWINASGVRSKDWFKLPLIQQPPVLHTIFKHAIILRPAFILIYFNALCYRGLYKLVKCIYLGTRDQIFLTRGWENASVGKSLMVGTNSVVA